MWGWQAKLCDPLVTHRLCLTSIIDVLRDNLLGLSFLSCVTACCMVEQFVVTELKAAKLLIMYIKISH